MRLCYFNDFRLGVVKGVADDAETAIAGKIAMAVERWRRRKSNSHPPTARQRPTDHEVGKGRPYGKSANEFAAGRDRGTEAQGV